MFGFGQIATAFIHTFQNYHTGIEGHRAIAVVPIGEHWGKWVNKSRSRRSELNHNKTEFVFIDLHMVTYFRLKHSIEKRMKYNKFIQYIPEIHIQL